jgi:hypothetical protein
MKCLIDYSEGTAEAVEYHRWLVASFLSWKPRFISGAVHMGFAAEKVALGQVFR